MCEDMKTSSYEPEVTEPVCVLNAWSEVVYTKVEESWTDSRVSVPEQYSQSNVEACFARVSFKKAEVTEETWADSTSRISLCERENQFVKIETCTSQASLPDKINCSSDKFRNSETDGWCDSTSHQSLPEVENAETFRPDRWSDSASHVSLPGHVEEVTSDTEPMAAVEPSSEMYYTASSEVSLLSDIEVAGNQMDDSVTDSTRECVLVAGHVAAMRERFESMTRANTPCPDLARALSPTLDAIANVAPSPDLLG